MLLVRWLRLQVRQGCWPGVRELGQHPPGAPPGLQLVSGLQDTTDGEPEVAFASCLQRNKGQRLQAHLQYWSGMVSSHEHCMEWHAAMSQPL